MLKYYLLSLIIFTQNIYGVKISKSQDFSLQHKAKFKQTSFEVTIENKDQNIIEDTIHKLNNSVKKSNICTGGEYQIYPKYRWDEHKKIDMGYTSHINYNCQFEHKQNYEYLLDDVKKIKGIKLKQNRVSFVQTQEEKVQKTQELENIAFDFAKVYVQKLNKKFNACKIESINLSSNHSVYLRKQNAMALSNERSKPISKVSVPLNNAFKNSLKVDYIFLCNQ